MSNDVSFSVEELLAVIIWSQGGRIKVPTIDFTEAEINGKIIAIDQLNEGRVICLSLQDEEEVVYDEGN